MEYRIIFSRRDKNAVHPGFVGFGGDFVGRGEDPYFDVCRAMKDAGMPDAPVIFVDERGMACLTVRSLHSCARRYRPTDDELSARKERAKQKDAHAPSKEDTNA